MKTIAGSDYIEDYIDKSLTEETSIMKLAYENGYSYGWRDVTDNVLESRIEMALWCA